MVLSTGSDANPDRKTDFMMLFPALRKNSVTASTPPAVAPPNMIADTGADETAATTAMINPARMAVYQRR